MASSSKRRAVGVVRVSRVGERDGESFVSPSEQRERIQSACARDGLRLVEVLEEPNVSGGAPLERRRGLRQAVGLLEAGEADVIVVLLRSARALPAVQAEVVERVERAAGRSWRSTSGRYARIRCRVGSRRRCWEWLPSTTDA
jgi:hypothetical protein